MTKDIFKNVRFSPKVFAHLGELADLEIYGDSESEVIRTFVMDGIQKAVEAGVIKPKPSKKRET